MPKVVLYNAISADGFIAGLDGDSDWVDDALFEQAVLQRGCIILGRTTFEQYKGELYPIEGVQHLVLTRGNLEASARVHAVNAVDEALKKAAELGFEEVLLIGGSKANESLARAGVVEELILDVHPLVLGEGLRLLGNCTETFRLELIASTCYGQLVQNRYKIVY